MSKRALVTGGSRGIGRAVSRMLSQQGFHVIINFRSNIDSARALQKELKDEFGNSSSLLQFDVGDFQQARSKIEEELKDNGPVDVLVFNAGIRNDSLFPVMGEDQWNTVLDVNLKSFYYITKPISKAMFEMKSGKIVVISSAAGQFGMQGQVNYSASKAGLIGAARSLSVELARRGINVNVVAPGFIETEMVQDLKDRFGEIKKTIPLRKIGSPDDIANTVEFLISDKASYIVGQVIGVNGGIG